MNALLEIGQLILSDPIEQRLRADCGQKQDPGEWMQRKGIDTGGPVTEVRLSHIAPIGHAHINMRGIISFDFWKAQLAILGVPPQAAVGQS